MHRRAFLTGLVAISGAAPVWAAMDDVDPAVSSIKPALRVLLGRGQASMLGPGEFLFNGRHYRGSFSLLPNGDVVNLVDIESYLYSVVTREMPPSWPISALQAQAIAARTYVLARSNPQRAYDVVPSEIDQVYSGIESETESGRAAVSATAGDVLQLDGHFASIAYSSCCGGHTENAGDAWGGRAPVNLRGVVCGYCTDSPWYRWTRTLRLADLAVAFAAELQGEAIIGFAASDIDRSGRARAFSLQTERGVRSIPATRARARIGTRVLPSLLVHSISPPQADGTVVIEGGGLGHGVGLCQWGARGLARTNASALAILSWYFPGTTTAHE